MNRSACPYAVLGVARNCTVREVNSAWRKLSLKCHPDRLKESDPDLQRQYTIQFQCITEAKNELLAKLPPDESRSTRTVPPRRPRPPAWQAPVNRSTPKAPFAPPRAGTSTSSTSRPSAPERPPRVPKEAAKPPGPSSGWQPRGQSEKFPRIPQDPRPAETARKGSPEASAKPAYVLLSPVRNERWPGEDGDGRFRTGAKPAGIPMGNQGRRNGPLSTPECPRYETRQNPHGPNYAQYGLAPSDSDSDFSSDEDDTPVHMDAPRTSGLATNVMDLLDDDLAMPAPSRRKPPDSTAKTIPPPMAVPTPKAKEPLLPAHVPGEHLLQRPLTRAFHIFLNASMGLGRRTHALNMKARAPVPPSTPDPIPTPATDEAADKSSSAVSDDTSDTSSSSHWNADPAEVWDPTTADHCGPTQVPTDIFAEAASPCAPPATVVDVDEVVESPEVVVVTPSVAEKPAPAVTAEVDVSDANSTSSGTSLPPDHGHKQPKDPMPSHKRPLASEAQDPMVKSPVSNSASGSKRQKKQLEEHSLPVRVRLGYLMERFSLIEEEAEIVRRAIVSLRAKGKEDGLRVSKIFKGHDPRNVTILKSLPIFNVFVALSDKSCKRVHKVCLRHPEHDSATQDAGAEVRNMVSISSGSSGDELDDDDIGTIIRKSCQHLLPWTYKADREEIWDR